MFNHMEISEQVSKKGTFSKTTIRAYADRSSHVRKLKEGESTSLTNPNMVRAGKCKKIRSPSKRSAKR